MVPEVGLEPTQGCPYQILSLARLPVSPLGLFESFKIIKIEYEIILKKN